MPPDMGRLLAIAARKGMQILAPRPLSESLIDTAKSGMRA